MPRTLRQASSIVIPALLCAGWVVPGWSDAPARSVPIVVDGHLADLEAVVMTRLGPGAGGFLCTDLTGEIATIICSYFVNGYDTQRFLLLIEPLRDANGSPTGDVDLFAGWEQVGLIGDSDGNGDPDTDHPLSPCGSSDEPGIGPSEFYRIHFDFDGDGTADAVLAVNDNRVVNRSNSLSMPGAVFASQANRLELKIPALRSGLESTGHGTAVDICHMRLWSVTSSFLGVLVPDVCQSAYEYECTVPTLRSSWGTLKATYR